MFDYDRMTQRQHALQITTKSPQMHVIFTQTTTVLVVRLATEFRCTSIFYGSGSIVLEYVIRYITRHGEKRRRTFVHQNLCHSKVYFEYDMSHQYDAPICICEINESSQCAIISLMLYDGLEKVHSVSSSMMEF
jgi:predicted DNA binding protein